jgi:Skp family chaperone for outer membrane proteins
MKVADASKMAEYLSSPRNAESNNDASIENKLTSKIQTYLQNVSNSNKTGNAMKSNKWIYFDPTKHFNRKSSISVLENPADSLEEGIKNIFETLLMKANLTDTHLIKLTRIISLMAKSILLQAKSNPQYDRELIDSQIQNMTKKTLELLQKMNSAQNKYQSKTYTEGMVCLFLIYL